MRAELLLSVYRYGAAVNEDNLVWDHPLCILKLVSALTLSSRGQFKNFTPSSLSLGIVNNLIEFVFFPMIPTILMCRVSSSTDISLRFCYQSTVNCIGLIGCARKVAPYGTKPTQIVKKEDQRGGLTMKGKASQLPTRSRTCLFCKYSQI